MQPSRLGRDAGTRRRDTPTASSRDLDGDVGGDAGKDVAVFDPLMRL